MLVALDVCGLSCCDFQRLANSCALRVALVGADSYDVELTQGSEVDGHVVAYGHLSGWLVGESNGDNERRDLISSTVLLWSPIIFFAASLSSQK